MSPKRSPPRAHGGSLLWCLAQQLLAWRLRPPALKILARRLPTLPRLARRLQRSAAGGFPLSITALGRGRYLHLLAGGYSAAPRTQLLRARRQLLRAPQLFARLLQRRARPVLLHAAPCLAAARPCAPLSSASLGCCCCQHRSSSLGGRSAADGGWPAAQLARSDTAPRPTLQRPTRLLLQRHGRPRSAAGAAAGGWPAPQLARSATAPRPTLQRPTRLLLQRHGRPHSAAARPRAPLSSASLGCCCCCCQHRSSSLGGCSAVAGGRRLACAAARSLGGCAAADLRRKNCGGSTDVESRWRRG